MTKQLKSKRTSYFIIFLKPPNVNLIGIVKLVSIVKLYIGPVLKYCAPLFHHSIPMHISCPKILKLYKSALHADEIRKYFREILEYFNLQTLFQRHH